MRPLFFVSDGNLRLQSDPRHLTSNLTLKVNSCREMDFIFGMGVGTLTYNYDFVTIGRGRWNCVMPLSLASRTSEESIRQGGGGGEGASTPPPVPARVHHEHTSMTFTG